MKEQLIEALVYSNHPAWTKRAKDRPDCLPLIAEAIIMNFKHENGNSWETPYPLGVKAAGMAIAKNDYQRLVDIYLELHLGKPGQKQTFAGLKMATLDALVLHSDVVGHIALMQYWFCPKSKGGLIHKYKCYLTEGKGMAQDTAEAMVQALFTSVTLMGWPVVSPGQYGMIGSQDSSFSKLEWRQNMPYTREECEAFFKNIRNDSAERAYAKMREGIPTQSSTNWWLQSASKNERQMIYQAQGFNLDPVKTMAYYEPSPPKATKREDEDSLAQNRADSTLNQLAEELRNNHIEIISSPDSNTIIA